MHLTFKTHIPRPDDTEAQATVHVDYTPGHPGNSNGHPDSWTPPEPAEVEILAVEGEASAQEVAAYFEDRWQALEDLAEMAWQLSRAQLRRFAS